MKWIESADQWDFKPGRRPTKKARRLANDAVATLKGLGWLKRRQIELETVETFMVEAEKLERFIMQNHYDLMGRFGVRDNVVIIGSKQWFELTRYMVTQPFLINMADFSFPVNQNRLHGLMVVILPWMDGTVLVPKEYLPIEQKLVPSGVMVTDEARRRIEMEREGLLAAKLWNDYMGRTDDQE